MVTNNKKSKVILIDDSRETYTSEKDDITIIELRNNDKLNINSFLYIDDDVYNNNIDEMNLLYLLDCKGKKILNIRVVYLKVLIKITILLNNHVQLI